MFTIYGWENGGSENMEKLNEMTQQAKWYHYDLYIHSMPKLVLFITKLFDTTLSPNTKARKEYY